MSGHPGGERGLCCLGKFAQRVGCLPDKSKTNTHYRIIIRPADDGNGHNYIHDNKFKPGPPLPPLQPIACATPFQILQAPEIPKKTPVVKTVPLKTLPLPVNTLPGWNPATPYVTPRAEPPVIPPTHIDYTPPTHIDYTPPTHIDYTPPTPPLSAIPQTPYQNTVPNSIFQDLGKIAPTQYIWNTPHGSLMYTPASTSAPLLPNPLSNTPVYPSRIIDLGDGNDEPTGLGVIPSPISSGASDLSFNRTILDRCSEITLNLLLTPNYRLPQGTQIKWDVSEPVGRARHVLDDARFIASANEPATDPPTNTLRIEVHFIDNPGTKWNWEPITIRKPSSVRIIGILHAIHDYFQTQLTRAEYDIIKSHGNSNARIVRDSWCSRVNSQPEGGARSSIYHGGLRRVDCLGSSKNFAGLWVDGTLLKLGLHA